MRKTMKLFQIGLRQITKDGMLLVLIPAPFLIGVIFKFAVPFANSLTEEKLSFSFIPWYGLIDGLLACLTPIFTAMITAFLLLEERDEGIGIFYQITPVGGYSYLTARIGIPMVWASLETVIVLTVFNVSCLSLPTILTGSLLSTITGIFMAMMVVSIAGNRVEGLALSKLMGVCLLGLPVPWVIHTPYKYIAAFLPSFWIGELLYQAFSVFSFTGGLISCIIWIFLFMNKFLRKI